MAIRKRISIELLYWSDLQVASWEKEQALAALRRDGTNYQPVPVVECRDLRKKRDGYAVCSGAAWVKAADELGLADLVCLVQSVSEAESDPATTIKFRPR